MWPSSIARSQAGQGVGRGSSCGVTIAVLASALPTADPSSSSPLVSAAVAVAYVRAGPAGSSGGRPNDVNRPGSAKATIRAMPVAVSVSTCSACARYTPRSSRR